MIWSLLFSCLALHLVCLDAAYNVVSHRTTPTGMTFTLDFDGHKGPYGVDITPLQCDISLDSPTIARIKIFDPKNLRYEVPTSVLPPPADNNELKLAQYSVSFTTTPFTVAVTRISDGEVLINTTSQLVFEDQYLEFTTTSATKGTSTLYGLGERIRPLALDQRTYTLWNVDVGTPSNENLYGHHPFYMEMRSRGAAHGFFMRSSNGMDIVVGKNTVTWKIIGGILDAYVFVGPTPKLVTQQYQKFIGLPHMPPLWSLGFHQCRYGYPNLETVEQVVQKYADAKIPLQTMWTDIDYMDAYRDFTWDPKNFPSADFSKFVDKLHQQDQTYVVIVDPGIAPVKGYAPYDSGVQRNVFIKKADGEEFRGRVWPGTVVFPDWFNENATDWWTEQIAKFISTVPYDGLWIDMNEISNFCDGNCEPDGAFSSFASSKSSFGPNNPPYAINNHNNKAPLFQKTISMDCRHGTNPLNIEYNTHNLFGMMESIATKIALEKTRKKRAFVLSRSSYAGSGHHTGHWLGDNDSDWQAIKDAIPGVLNMNMFGIPLVGADICGFGGSATEELCARWMAVGAFYPFSRNHNNKGSPSQEPYLWESVAQVSRLALGARYSLLSYYNTYFYLANKEGETVARPLFFEFPDDTLTLDIDKQFLIGPSVLISPVLDAGATTVSAYFPPASSWYDFWTYNPIRSGQQTLQAPLQTIPVHIRGGSIIPRQKPELLVSETRKSPFEIVVALNSAAAIAQGSLFLDDGESLDVGSDSLFVTFSCSSSVLSSSPVVSGNLDSVTAASTVQIVSVLGVSATPTSVLVNGQVYSNWKHQSNSCLSIEGLSLLLSRKFTVEWK